MVRMEMLNGNVWLIPRSTQNVLEKNPLSVTVIKSLSKFCSKIANLFLAQSPLQGKSSELSNGNYTYLF